jgi:deferrochelatase/peroxidase EfeB
MTDDIFTAQDNLNDIKRRYHQGQDGITYDDMKQAVITLWQLRNEKLKKMGRKPRKITATLIASELR